jgi:hypothetical protein
MNMGHTHLSEERLIEVCLDVAPEAREREHLEICAECGHRRAEIARMLTDLRDAAVVEADAAFPADRLVRQQARILQRLEHEGRPARIIAFPAHGAEPSILRTRPAMRWIAGAAAAGLVIGLLAGHLAHDFSITRPASRSQVAVAARQALPAAPTLRAVATTISEDEFLGQIELAIEGTGGTALRPLDDLTPRVWEVTAR